MDKLKTLEDVNQSGFLLYKYIRGSHAYGLATEISDVDTAGVFSMPLQTLIGTRYDYTDQVQDEKSDNVYYELEKYIRLLGVSNPNMLESLFVPERCIIYEHPAIKILKAQRDKFLTKQCFNSFFGYATSQIKKARGLNKKCVNPIVKRKDILDFCYTRYNQGSTNIANWLSYRYLSQEYCGCVNVPNMPNTVSVYYDWKRFFQDYVFDDLFKRSHEPLNTGYLTQAEIVSELKRLNNGEIPDRSDPLETYRQLYYDYDTLRIRAMFQFIIDNVLDDCSTYSNTELELKAWYKSLMERPEDYMYRGILNSEGNNNELRLSSVAKGEKAICDMTFNQNGYSEHCRKYREYKQWEKDRNPIRYESNLNKNYDAKNMSHAFRLVAMGIEIARGEGFKCDRTGIDDEFLLAIKRHQYEYDELIDKLEVMVEEMNDAMERSTLPDGIDPDFLNKLCTEIRWAAWENPVVYTEA